MSEIEVYMRQMIKQGKGASGNKLSGAAAVAFMASLKNGA